MGRAEHVYYPCPSVSIRVPIGAEYNQSTMFTYLRNLFKLARGDRHLHPRAVVFYVTGQCNLNCAYCEDFGARRMNRS
jgi:pyruvate formate-lyase activating enzyme-like uncharacterized protein